MAQILHNFVYMINASISTLQSAVAAVNAAQPPNAADVVLAGDPRSFATRTSDFNSQRTATLAGYANAIAALQAINTTPQTL